MSPNFFFNGREGGHVSYADMYKAVSHTELTLQELALFGLCGFCHCVVVVLSFWFDFGGQGFSV